MSTDTLTPRDELALRAPITFDQARDLWMAANPGTGPNLRDAIERRAFWAFWRTLCLEWADVALETSMDPPYTPGENAAEDRRLDRPLLTLGWFDQRTCTWLKRGGVQTLRQLLATNVYELEKLNGIGARDGTGRLLDIINRLNYEGLRLAPRLAPVDPVVDHEPAPGVGSEEVGT